MMGWTDVRGPGINLLLIRNTHHAEAPSWTIRYGVPATMNTHDLVIWPRLEERA